MPPLQTITALLLTIPLVWACSEKASSPRHDPVPVAVLHLAGDAGQETDTGNRFEGILRPRRTIDLSFKQSGRIAHALVQVGDHVRKGQPLIILAADEQNAALQQARGEAIAAQADARRAADLALRGKGLDNDGALSTSEVRSRAWMAQAAKGKAQAADAGVLTARLHLAGTVLVAPEDGIVTAVPAEPGAVVAAGAMAAQLAGGTIEAEVRLPPTLPVHAGQSATVTYDDGAAASPAIIAAIIRAVDPALDAATHQRIVHVTLNTQAPLAINDTVSVNFSGTPSARGATQQGANTLLRVPLTALIQQGPGTASVWQVMPDGHAIAARRVTVHGLRGADALVSGLTAGVTIVASGPEALRADAQIRIVDRQEQR